MCSQGDDFENAFEFLNTEVSVSADREEILACDALVLPGVGNFSGGMQNLRTRGLIGVLNKAVFAKKAPILGICLGMALLFNHSEEDDCEGLKLIDGRIKKFNVNKKDLKVPHMGWNKVKHLGDHFLLRDIPDESSFYFVHSYCCLESVDAITETTHGNKFISALAKDNIFAVQFHPEKSQNSGLQLYKNFLDWSI